jgi:hypothetical protein
MKLSKKTHAEHNKEVDPARFSQNGIEGSFSQDDFLGEKLRDCMQCNPLGRLLKVIAALPEIRIEKIEQGLRHVEHADDCWDTKMDVVLDRVLEELITEE